MKILISSLSMSYLSGQPLYTYELAMELRRRGHSVLVASKWNHSDIPTAEGYKLKENLEKAEIGIVPIEDIKNCKDGIQNLDLIIASENCSEAVMDVFPEVPAINIIHSEYEYETPINDRNQIKWYVCIRPSIAAHIMGKHDIPPYKVKVIYNGVDCKRFDEKKRIKKDKGYYKVVVPCTLDTMRQKFLNYEINSATEKRRVYLYGSYCGAQLNSNPWAYVFPDKFNIEEAMADADEVAGILLGRVNLEAWAMGIKSTIFDPETLKNYTMERPRQFFERHNIVNVVNQLLELI